ncbi:hypothetical protein JGH11_17355 [Dysgonomonas sp. Marseille-P4677]|uniref:hypothetical protein n=1 Tax=Dysgonomonas sp. Marseille-P4677 TaxID=2364790 RepID=UPI0019137A46|nr:hypothetical protein [Dysgonomonas sp. Marseille-P4677]MBK5722645.1 hypothetical protein [Dysgonomonas sp. Marseille-P4677]
MKEKDTDERQDHTYDSEDHCVPERFLTFLVIAQSCIIGLLFYLIGLTYSKNSDLLYSILQLIICPLSIATTLYFGWKRTKLPANKRKLKLALRILGIIVAAIVLVYLATIIFALILAAILKSGNSGGGNPWL